MTLKKNILANYVGAGTAALAPILALPWYLSALGPKQFGLVGFIVMLQALLGLVDAGMSQALVREFSVRLDASGNGRRAAATLLFGFERIYWVFALCTGCVVLLLSGTIAAHWLNLTDLPVALGRDAICGAAIIFAVQFPGSIYRSLLVGAQAQLALNGVQSVFALLRHGGGAVIVFFWPTLTAYLSWQASIALLETLARSRFAWKALGIQRGQLQWDVQVLRPVWRMVLGMSAATWLGALTVQMDKIILSRLASIEQFGYYTIAATVAAGVLQLIYPLVQAVLPRAVQLRAQPIALRDLSIKLTWLIGLLAGCGGLIFMTAGEWLLNIWLKNPVAVDNIYPLLALLLVGSGLNAFYNVGYMNWVVHEKVSRILQVNVMALVLSVALIPFFVTQEGPVGAAFGWLAINLIGFMLSLEWLKKKKNERSY